MDVVCTRPACHRAQDLNATGYCITCGDVMQCIERGRGMEKSLDEINMDLFNTFCARYNRHTQSLNKPHEDKIHAYTTTINREQRTKFN